MIISHLHKYIYWHSPKCAGTSVSVNLAKHTGDGDVVTKHEHLPQYDEDFNEAKGKNIKGLTTHTLPYPTDYLSVSTKRNPFDQVVSQFHWYQCKKSFEWFVMGEHFTDCNPFWGGMDFYIDFENLDSSYRELCAMIGIPYERLPRTKTKVRPKTPYQDYYDNETREKIAEHYKEVIKRFDYSF